MSLENFRIQKNSKTLSELEAKGYLGVKKAEEILERSDTTYYDNLKSKFVQEILIDDSILSICKTRTAPMKRAGQMLKEQAAEGSLRLKTGFEPLDKVLCGGFNRRGICQILGQPKTGKTTFMHLCMKHYLENNKKKILYLSPIDETKVLHKRIGSNHYASRIVAEFPNDSSRLMNILVKLLNELSGDDTSKMLEVYQDLQNRPEEPAKKTEGAEAKKPLDLQNIEMIVIDNLGYLLYEMEISFDHTLLYTRAIGTLLRKISDTYAIPVVVSSLLRAKTEELSMTVSPWHNFPGDQIVIEKVSMKDPTGKDINVVLHKLVQSKVAPFYLSKGNNIPKELRLKFKLAVSSLSDVGDTQKKPVISVEKVISFA